MSNTDRARRIVHELRKKTVANGCTPAEARSAQARADAIAKKYKLAPPAAPIPAEPYGPPPPGWIDVVVNGRRTRMPVSTFAMHVAQEFVKFYQRKPTFRRRS